MAAKPDTSGLGLTENSSADGLMAAIKGRGQRQTWAKLIMIMIKIKIIFITWDWWSIL